MPYMKGKRRSRKRKSEYRSKKKRKQSRSRSRSRRRRRSMASVSIPGVMMPDTCYTTLVFHSTYIGPIIAGDTDLYNFAGNGLTFPDLGVSATQTPGGFDQFMQFYQKYEVIWSSISFTITNESDVNPFRITLVPQEVLTPPGITTASEQRYTKEMTVGVATNSNSTRTIRGLMNTRKMKGRSTADQKFLGTLIANPVELWYWQVYIKGLRVYVDSNEDIIFSCRVKLRYRVKFSERELAL